MNEPVKSRPSRTDPIVQLGVRGPRGEAGFLLRAPTVEPLIWDLEHEIVSARRAWRIEDQGWWIASSYFDTAIDIVLRFFPTVRIRYPESGEERILYADEPPARRRVP